MWEKIVLNLISNAFKFTFEGEIGVSAAQRAGDGMRLQVRDTGVGIPAARAAAHLRAVPPRRGRASGGRTKAPASAWRWCRSWSSCTAAPSTSTASSAAARRSRSRFRSASAHLPRRADRRRPRVGVHGALDVGTFVDEAARWLPDAADGVAAAVRAAGASRRPRSHETRAHPARRRQRRHARLPERACSAQRWSRGTSAADGARGAGRSRATQPPDLVDHRRDDAAARRLRPAARAASRRAHAAHSGHDAVGARRGGVAARGLSGGRGRLSGQAVHRARAGRPGRGAAAARASARDRGAQRRAGSPSVFCAGAGADRDPARPRPCVRDGQRLVPRGARSTAPSSGKPMRRGAAGAEGPGHLELLDRVYATGAAVRRAIAAA